ncbi:triose-phosphate isomerase [Alcaligenes sp. 13f]|uniref:triose-phosphate isomerase n=1 Tax=Alcaligenes sp. 13f TaxID=2841924 RepID=UPI001CF6A719|nr:triose-phosphate isomerase [Alcaligenes sp. 13f]MCB4322861.1 triose-phosphate isomerase [Alcaligenes sp. 13f]
MSVHSSRKRLVAGNWKLNGSLDGNSRLLQELLVQPGAQADCDVLVCVPYVYLPQVAGILKGSTIAVGAQDVSVHAKGAYTGEISAAMLADIGCRWVIVGHSERRQYHQESSAQVAAKVVAALDAGLTPIVCIGEQLADREAGQETCVVQDQLEPIKALGAEVVSKLVLAYEPVWAIGTGLTATPEQAQQMHQQIRAYMESDQLRILYGGSVKADNAAELFAMPDIDGALVGGASLDAQEFLRIVAA